jgi:hypothetical protein
MGGGESWIKFTSGMWMDAMKRICPHGIGSLEKTSICLWKNMVVPLG